MLNKPNWYTRAWTFQESTVSRRTIVFVNGTVYWYCRSASCYEAYSGESTHRNIIALGNWPAYALTLHPWPNLAQTSISFVDIILAVCLSRAILLELSQLSLLFSAAHSQIASSSVCPSSYSTLDYCGQDRDLWNDGKLSQAGHGSDGQEKSNLKWMTHGALTLEPISSWKCCHGRVDEGTEWKSGTASNRQFLPPLQTNDPRFRHRITRWVD